MRKILLPLILAAIMLAACCAMGFAEEACTEVWENAAGQKGSVVHEYTEWGALERTRLILDGTGEAWRTIEYSALEDGGFMRHYQNHYDETGEKRFVMDISYYNDGFDTDTAVPMAIQINDMQDDDIYRDTRYGDNGTHTDNTYVQDYGEKSYWITRYDESGLPTIVFVYNYDGSQDSVWTVETQDGAITGVTRFGEYSYQAGYVGGVMSAQYDEDGRLIGFGIEESNGVRFTFDESGNIASRTFSDYGSPRSQTFTYDAEGNVVRCVYTHYETTHEFVYELNPDGTIVGE